MCSLANYGGPHGPSVSPVLKLLSSILMLALASSCAAVSAVIALLPDPGPGPHAHFMRSSLIPELGSSLSPFGASRKTAKPPVGSSRYGSNGRGKTRHRDSDTCRCSNTDRNTEDYMRIYWYTVHRHSPNATCVGHGNMEYLMRSLLAPRMHCMSPSMRPKRQ